MSQQSETSRKNREENPRASEAPALELQVYRCYRNDKQIARLQ